MKEKGALLLAILRIWYHVVCNTPFN